LSTRANQSEKYPSWAKEKFDRRKRTSKNENKPCLRIPPPI
jgi:hypothetical protein